MELLSSNKEGPDTNECKMLLRYVSMKKNVKEWLQPPNERDNQLQTAVKVIALSPVR
jgi:hypothetical protein